MKLLNLWLADHPCSDQDQRCNYKYIFLSRTYLLLIAIVCGITIYRWGANPWINAINLSSLIAGSALFFYLRRHPENVEAVSTITILMSSAACLGIYLVSLDNQLRLVLFYPLIAAIFHLKGSRAGLAGMFAVIVWIVAVEMFPGMDTGYKSIELVVAIVYLILLFFILWNYELVRERQQKREQEFMLEKLMAERWQLALEGAGDAIWDWDIASNSLMYSNSYAEMLGYNETEFGHDLSRQFELQHSDDKDEKQTYFQEFLAGKHGEQYSLELRLRCKDGSYKWVLCRGRVIKRDESGRPLRMVGTHVDISELKDIERSLKESEISLHLALDSAHMGVWEFDAGSQKLYWSPEIYRILDAGSEEADVESLLKERVYPEDVPRIAAQMASSLAEIAPYRVQYRIRVKGKIRWLEERGEVQCDVKGKVLRVVGTTQDITESKEYEKQLRHIAHYDALTGVPNRVLLADRMMQSLARTRREHELMAVCYLDLDGFKPINDSFGHENGDRVLVEITRRIKSEIHEDDTVARLGGDEFVVLLLGLRHQEECVVSLMRLLDAIYQPIEIHGKSLRISASIGVSLYPDDDQDADTLLRHADQAMYVAKQSGKNRYHLFDATKDQLVRTYRELQSQIRSGLEQGQFELYYQPKVEMQTGRMVGAEALIRWHHPQRGLLLPGDFLRAIENSELDIELGEWVVSTALAQIRQWQRAGIELGLSINISAYHLQSPDFAEKLRGHLFQCCTTGCAKGCDQRLEIEILETAALDDMAKVAEIIGACREIGVHFALDDFGTGYSSLTYLSNLEVNTLKIDQSFVRDMLEDKGDEAIVQGTIALAKAFGRGIVAEGVETEAHYQNLVLMGCEVGQGFGIARPMPVAKLFEWHANWSGRRQQQS